MQRSSLSPLPSFLNETPRGRLASRWSEVREQLSGRMPSIRASWRWRFGASSARLPGIWTAWRTRAVSRSRVGGSVRLPAQTDNIACPRYERLQFVAVIVALHALLAALGLSIAALPMIVGGAGVAAMVVWIGWFWPDEA